jgi:hypothetical protein
MDRTIAPMTSEKEQSFSQFHTPTVPILYRSIGTKRKLVCNLLILNGWLPGVDRNHDLPPGAGILAFWYYALMAMRKMTFSVPESLAAQLLRKVPSRDRSRFVSEALAARLEEREVALIRACEVANQDLDVTEIEKEFDGIRDEMAEPWK